MMTIDMSESQPTTAQLDESAVAAVRRGDAERYRELVERHERRVFAVAWSRLGDAALAEEATQEAFIRAYRRLWLLGDGTKFSGWVSTIARRVAINLGLRHRRELNKRERWALENADDSSKETFIPENDPLHTPDSLRQTLAELPDAHRECLLLYYLEGKSGAEAAAVLGISESAFRVRLHRARTVVRERLEEKLEGSLTRLRPAKTLVPAIMAVVLASSTAKAAAGGTAAVGMGAKIASVLGKSFLFSWLAPLIFLATQLPGMLVASFIVRKERQNFRNPDGFRPELHRQAFNSFIWSFPLVIVLMVVVGWSTHAAFGDKGSHLVLGCFLLLVLTKAARFALFVRNPQAVNTFVYCFINLAGILALWLGWIPLRLASLPIFLGTTWFFITFKRPMRMDYSLFLRAAQGLLKDSEPTHEASITNRFDRRDLLAFARFLGAHYLICNHRWQTNGLALRLMPVKGRFLTSMTVIYMPPIPQNCSYILLGWDGTIQAHCGKTDAQDLLGLKHAGLTEPQELKRLVEESLVRAWHEFRNGNSRAAERMIGDSPESEVFLVPPARSKSMLWWRIFVGLSAVLMIPALGLHFLPLGLRTRLDGMKPICITEAQVREFLSLVSTNPNPLIETSVGGTKGWTQKGYPWDPSMALLTCILLPDTNLFTPHSAGMMHTSVFSGANPQTQERQKNVWLCSYPLSKRGLVGGWIEWPDLNVSKEVVAKELHQGTSHEIEFKFEYLLTHEAAWSWVESKRWEVMRVSQYTFNQLRWLRAVNCLDLVDRERLIAQIVSVQTLSADPPGNPPIHDWKDVRGLFFTPNSPALEDTYYSVAALEILGGLDKIDREACIQGILSRHAGQGYFTSPVSGGYNEYHINGSTRDTIAAFETLRILGGLYRLKDLDQWQFRVASYDSSKPDAKGARILSWSEIEAWVAQQRLAKILKAHKENPQAPVGSLLQP